MAVNRGNRPLSPHLTIYRWPLSMAMSILHRTTGVGLALFALLLVWWFLAAGSSPQAFARADGFLTSWFGLLVLFFLMIAFWYHFFNGIRHLMWDTGYGLELDQVKQSGVAVLIATAVFVVLTLIFALTLA